MGCPMSSASGWQHPSRAGQSAHLLGASGTVEMGDSCNAAQCTEAHRGVRPELLCDLHPQHRAVLRRCPVGRVGMLCRRGVSGRTGLLARAGVTASEAIYAHRGVI